MTASWRRSPLPSTWGWTQYSDGQVGHLDLDQTDLRFLTELALVLVGVVKRQRQAAADVKVNVLLTLYG
jgi:hypothetical protein